MRMYVGGGHFVGSHDVRFEVAVLAPLFVHLNNGEGVEEIYSTSCTSLAVIHGYIEMGT